MLKLFRENKPTFNVDKEQKTFQEIFHSLFRIQIPGRRAQIGLERSRCAPKDAVYKLLGEEEDSTTSFVEIDSVRYDVAMSYVTLSVYNELLLTRNVLRVFHARNIYKILLFLNYRHRDNIDFACERPIVILTNCRETSLISNTITVLNMLREHCVPFKKM